MPEQELNLVEFSAGRRHKRAQARRKSRGASFSIPARLAASFTTSHSTFGVMPSPHTLPDLLIERNTVPLVIPAAVLPTSTAALTHCGTGTVRIFPALPFKLAEPPRLFEPKWSEEIIRETTRMANDEEDRHVSAAAHERDSTRICGVGFQHNPRRIALISR